MGKIEIDVYVRFEGSEKAFLELHLDETRIRELSKVADVIEELKKVGKVFGLG